VENRQIQVAPTKCNYAWVSDQSQYHAYVHYQYLGVTWNSRQFAISSYWQHWKPREKTFPWHNLQSTILIGQVSILARGQLICRQVPTPFLFPVKGLIPSLIIIQSFVPTRASFASLQKTNLLIRSFSSFCTHDIAVSHSCTAIGMQEGGRGEIRERTTRY